MPERQIDSYPNLTPEYWAGHHIKDECSIEQFSSVEFTDIVFSIVSVGWQLQMRNRLKDQLERYELLQEGVYVPLARFEKGSVFVPDSYPHGTLIRVTSEVLNFNYMEQGYDGYDTAEQFGFVVDTTGITEDGKNAVLYVQKGRIYGGLSESIKVGEPQHTKTQVGSTLTSNYITRVNVVEIISLGGGSLKRVEGPSPQFIYPSPLPKPAPA